MPTRPELFFKSAGWRVVADGGEIAVRADSTLDVPEPEVALVINAFGEIVGYTICDDVSSRSIEGENPLYLPQAKIYYGACALGPTVRPAWEVADPYALGSSSLSAVAVLSPGRGRRAQPSSTGGTKKWSAT